MNRVNKKKEGALARNSIAHVKLSPKPGPEAGEPHKRYHTAACTGPPSVSRLLRVNSTFKSNIHLWFLPQSSKWFAL